ncbi:hypothetical protein ACQKWADRAFT_291059 [Trichoderma austrokoningii]
MFSPDPLNEPTISYPSFEPQSVSRRVTRSQRSRKFTSQAESSKRQITELEQGESSSSQRFAATVETEGHRADDNMATTPSGTRRKLFRSPAPRSPTVRRIGDGTITTSVPLRESADDELTTATTPGRRRSRPRLLNGTPMPTAGTKRRAASPVSRHSSRRQRTEKFTGGNATELHSDEKENIESGTRKSTKRGRPPKNPENVQSTTPKASPRRGRPPKNPVVEPSSELGATKKGRRRRAMVPDELVEIAAEAEAAAERSFARNSGRTVEAKGTNQNAHSEQQAEGDAVSNADAASDVWMRTIVDEATPRPAAPTRRPSATQSPSKGKSTGGSVRRRKVDHGHHAPETSDHSSVDDHPKDFASQNNDTIARGEDFSMIFMDSLPSFQGNLSANGTFMSTVDEDDEVGEETHLIINNTLASLRREVAQTSDPVEDATETIAIPDIPETEEPAEEIFVPIIRESARSVRLSLSPWWSRKPKKMGASPLKHQALMRSAAKRSGRIFSVEHREEPTPTKARKQTASTNSREQHPSDYSDTFSDIPQNYLDAPTPKPINFSAPQADREVDLMKFGLEGGDEEQAELEHAEDVDEPQGDPEEELGEEKEPAEQLEEEPAREPEEEQVEELEEEQAEEFEEEQAEEFEDEQAEKFEEEQAEEFGEELAEELEDEPVDEPDEEPPEENATRGGVLGGMIGYLRRRLSTFEMSSPVRHVIEEEGEEGEEGDDEVEEDNQYDEHEEYEEQDDQDQEQQHEEQPEEQAEEQYEEHGHEEDFGQDQRLNSDLLELEEEGEYDIGEYEDGEPEIIEEHEEQAEIDFEEHNEVSEAHMLEEELEGYAGQEEGMEDYPAHEVPEDREHDDHQHEINEDHEDQEEYPTSYQIHQFSDRWGAGNYLREQPAHDDIHIDEEMRSVSPEQPPGQLEPTPEREEQPTKVTPLHQMSSPPQEPQSLPQEPVPEKVVRSNFSSIMRAGRVLQSVTSDPPSPRVREMSLGSPFRRSANKEPSYALKEDRHQLLNKGPPQSMDFGSSQLTVVKLPVTHGVTTTETQAFGTNAGGADNAYGHGINDLAHKKRLLSRESIASSLGNTPSSNGAAHWAENEGPSSPSVRRERSILQAARSSVMRHPIPIVQLDGPAEEPDMAEEEEEPLEDEQVEEEQMDEQEVDKEPMDEQEMEEEYLDELQLDEEQVAEEEMEEECLHKEVEEHVDEVEEEHVDEEVEEEHVDEEVEGQQFENEQPEEKREEEEEEEDDEDDDDIDIWEYEAQREIPPRPELQSTTVSSAQDRIAVPVPSTSWRDTRQTTANFPVDASKTAQLKRTIDRQSNKVIRDEEPSLVVQDPQDKKPETATKSKRFDLSSFFSSPATITGILAEKFRSPKSKDLAKADVRQMEPTKPRQEPTTISATSMFSRAPPNENRQPALHRVDPASSPILSEPLEDDDRTNERSSSPGSPERSHLTTISQKQNFMPRPRQASNPLFQSSVSHPTAPTPPRRQLTHQDIKKWQHDTSNAGEDSSNSRLLLKPLPPRHASPKKSSLRSPLKPHTPGRVVEFSGNVLSPAEQARLRELRNQANEEVLGEDIIPTRTDPRAGKGSMASRQQQQKQPLPPRAIKPAGVTKKRRTKKRRRREPPSETAWTRQHWLFLDTLLQMRRQSPYSEKYAPVSQKYLGKTITSMGESMVLEKWHLECIDAFKSQIGGWDEGELAKRLFALILGEAKRRRSSVNRSPGVIFH